MSQNPKFDKDVELLKISLLAEEWRGVFLMQIGTVLTAFVAVSAVLIASEYANQLAPTIAIAAILAIGGVVYGTSRRSFITPYRKRLESLDSMLKKVLEGDSIGELSDLLKEKR